MSPTDTAEESSGERLAHILVAARRSNRSAPPPNDALVPVTVEAAEAVDDRVAALLGRQVIGWKIGCTSKHAQELLGTDGPFAGRIYDRYASGTTLPDDLPGRIYAEGEIAFRIGATLRADDPTSRQRVIDAIDATWPAIELVGGRFGDLFGHKLNVVIADAGSNRGIVLADPADVSPIVPTAAKDVALVMSVDGAVTGSGVGSDILGDPVDALVWLVERLAHRGIDLEVGQVVSVGTATGAAAIDPGSTATLTVEGLGTVEVTNSSFAR